MKILLQGSGGREYALAQNFAEHGHAVVGSPGNPAFRIMGIGDTHPYAGPEGFADYFVTGGFDLAVAGPEGPLRDGLGDIMHDRGLPFFGPRRAHARAEWDKGYLHELLESSGVMPPGQVSRSRKVARTYLHQHWKNGERYVIKSTELREGKGVIVPATVDEAYAAVDKIMLPPPQGWGDHVLLQRRLEGHSPTEAELSTMTIVGRGQGHASERTRNFESSKDNKPIGPNPLGLDPRMNTGGMGGDSPHPVLFPDEFQELLHSHTVPLIQAVEEDALAGEMVGVVYNGLMRQTNLGGHPIRILESNLGRFGDPETQYLLSRLKSDLAAYLKAAVEGGLSLLPPLEFDPRPSATLVFATPGYPTSEYSKHTGKRLRGLDMVDRNPNMKAFFAGVGDDKDDKGKLVNTGGRVFAVSLLADTREHAWDELYGLVDGGKGIGIGDGPQDVHFRPDLKNPEV